MNVDRKNSKTKTLIIVAILILIFSVIGVSYAAIFYSKTGEKVNTVSTGTMMMSYSENTNGISLTNAYPMTDEVGMALNQDRQYFDFTVSATTGGQSIINYMITATKEADSTLPDNAIKVYLTNTDGSRETQILAPTKVSDLSITSNSSGDAPSGQFILFASDFRESDTRNYRLRMWVSNDYVLPDAAMTYKLRVNVYGNVAV